MPNPTLQAVEAERSAVAVEVVEARGAASLWRVQTLWLRRPRRHPTIAVIRALKKKFNIVAKKSYMVTQPNDENLVPSVLAAGGPLL